MRVFCPNCGTAFQVTLEIDSIDLHPALFRIHWERSEVIHKCPDVIHGGDA